MNASRVEALAHADMIARARARVPLAIDVPLQARLRPWLICAAIAAVFVVCCIDLHIGPDVIGQGIGKMGVILWSMWPPSDGGQLGRLLIAIAQTLGIAVLGTVLGVLGAIPLGLMAARNLVRNAVVHFAVRRLLDIFRGIPVLVWALILVAAFGLGPLPGVLALAFADIPRLAKLFAEAIENIDRRQRESLQATGANSAAVIRFGMLPQVLPIWLSQSLYYLEQNFRAAAVVGVVGAGGIGFELNERIRIFAFDEVALITLLYILIVALLDEISQRLRAQLI